MVWLAGVAGVAGVGGCILLLAEALSSEPEAEPPLAFTVADAVHGLMAGGPTIVRRVANRLQGWVKAPGPVAQGEGQKKFCCVTTRGRNFRFGGRLRQRGRTLSALPARLFSLSVLGFGVRVLASPRLPPGGLPAA